MFIKIEQMKTLILATVSALFILILYIFSGLSFSVAGDINIANYLMSEAEPGFYFAFPQVMYVLNKMYLFFPSINWYMVFSLISVFLFVWVAVYIVDTIFSNLLLKRVILTIMVVLVWQGVCVEPINFTQTASLYTCAGLLLILFCQIKKGKAVQLLHIVIGCLFIYIGWMLRWNAALLCIPYALIVGSCTFITKFFGGYKLKGFFPCVIIVGCLGMCAVMTLVYAKTHEEWTEYYKSNTLRSDFYDYQYQYPDYEDNNELYRSINMDESYLNMLKDNRTGDLNHFSIKDLEPLMELRYDSEITKQSCKNVIKTFSSNGACLICLVVLGLIMLFVLVKDKKGSGLHLLVGAVATAVVVLYLAYIGRVAWRVVIGVMLGIYVYAITFFYEKRNVFNIVKPMINNIITIVCVLVIIIVIGKKYQFVMPDAEVTNIEKAEVLQYIDSEKNNVYVSSESLKFFNSHNAWSVPPDKTYADNLFVIKAHFILGQDKQLEKYGINNLFEDMLSKDNIYYVWDDLILSYLRSYYDKNISATLIDTCGETRFVRFMYPLELNSINVSDDEVISAKIERKGDFATIVCDIDDNGAEAERDYYCNLVEETSDIVLTYPLKYWEEEKKWKAQFVWDKRLDECSTGVKAIIYSKDGEMMRGVTNIVISP